MFEVGKSYTIRMWEDGEDGGVLTTFRQILADYPDGAVPLNPRRN